jgi:polysaccharide biosynthesis transport protein
MNVQHSSRHNGAEKAGGLPSLGRMSAQPPGEEGSDVIDIRRILLPIWRRKFLVLIITVLAAIAGVFVAAQSVPVYSASAQVLLTPERLNVVRMEQVVTADENIQNTIEIIRSNGLLGAVADRLELAATPAFNPALREDEASLRERVLGPLRRVLPNRSTLADLGLLPASPARQAASVPVDMVEARRASIVRSLRGGVTVSAVPGSRVVVITYRSTDPALAAQVANGIAEEFVREQREAQLAASRSATQWLSERVDELRVRVREAESLVRGARAELQQGGDQGAQITAQQLQVFVSALAASRAKRSTLEVRLAVLTDALQSGRDLGSIPELRASSVIQGHRQRINNLRDQEVSLRTVRTTDLVELRMLQARMDELNAGINLEAERIAESIAAELDAVRSEEQAMLDHIAELERRALSQGRDETRLRELEREAESSRRLYEGVFDRLNEISVQETLQTPSARLLNPAEATLAIATTRLQNAVMMSSVGGLAFAFVMVFLLERLNNTFRDLDEVEQRTGRPVLAVLPMIKKQRSLPQIVAHLRQDPASALAEAVRNLRTSILFMNIDSPPKVVMVTSSVPGEGKTATSLLLAMASQQAGKSTIIVDCDLRRASAGKAVAAQSGRPNLMSVLVGGATVEEAKIKDSETGLDMLTVGSLMRPSSQSAADILTSRSFSELVTSLRSSYDLVILDTPPVLMVTDARVVASVADATLYAVRCGHTPREAVVDGLRELDLVGVSVVGVVLTMVGKSARMRNAYAGYGPYGRYGD